MYKAFDNSGLTALTNYLKNTKKTADESSSAVSELEDDFQVLVQQIGDITSEVDGCLTELETVKAEASALSSHTENTTVHITAAERTAWNAKASTAAATTSAAGLMSASDKSKLDGISSGANKITVDSALSSSSTNPVQNKVINSALSGKLPTAGGTITGDITLDNSASGQSGEPSINWGTVGANANKPYIGFAKDQTDGTFMIGLKSETYKDGLAIGGGSGNLLWKGTKVATTDDITAAIGSAIAASY